jgi:hypothetical protein
MILDIVFTTTVISLLILIAFQIWQWLCVLSNLNRGEYVKKKDFLLRMLPGYFIIVLIRIAWNTFSRYMMLE